MHVVGHDHDRVSRFELVHEVFDAAVAIGSSAEHGSSIRITSGSTAMRPGDAEPLLLAARKRERALLSLSFTSSHSAALRQRLLDDVVEPPPCMPVHTRAERDVVVDRLRERVRLLEHHADAPPDLDRVDLGAVQVDAVVERARPSTCAPAIRSFMRLRQRRNVLLPQPDGPMNAVIALGADRGSTSSTAGTAP